MFRTPRLSILIALTAPALFIAFAPAIARGGDHGGGPNKPPPPAGSSEALLAALDMNYVEQVTTHLTTIGANSMGFRIFGTPEDKETANYLASEMKALGLSRPGLFKKLRRLGIRPAAAEAEELSG